MPSFMMTPTIPLMTRLTILSMEILMKLFKESLGLTLMKEVVLVVQELKKQCFDLLAQAPVWFVFPISSAKIQCGIVKNVIAFCICNAFKDGLKTAFINKEKIHIINFITAGAKCKNTDSSFKCPPGNFHDQCAYCGDYEAFFFRQG